MSAGLYSGVSGLALGIGLYRNVSGLWGGASGLIDGFGGSDPYAGASLYLNFLAGAPLDSRITFSRGTNATLTDNTGRITYAPANLLLRSQEFDSASWDKVTTSVTPNNAVAPDGTMTADTVTSNAVNSLIRQFLVFEAATYRFSLWLRRVSGTGVVEGTLNNFNYTNFALTSEWQRFSFSWTPIAGGNYFQVRFGSSGDVVEMWGAQLEQVTYQTSPGPYVATTAAAYYGPRFDYDPVTLAPKGLLIEEARTNLLTYSQDFTNAAWPKTNITVTAAATSSPDGTANAQRIAATAASGTVINSAAVAVAATSATFSVYAKQGTGPSIGNNFLLRNVTTAANLIGGSINYATGVWTYNVGSTGVSVSNAGNGWWRIQITATSGITSGDTLTGYAGWTGIVATAGDHNFAYGAQLEAGSFATSYIPTVASTVTRNADVATMTGTNFSSWYNQSEGTFVVGYDQLSADSRDIFIAASVGGAFNPGSVGIFGAGTSLGGYVRASSAYTAQANISTTLGDNTPLSAAVAYKVNDVAATAMGVTPAVATPPNAMPTTVVQLNIMGAGVTGTGKSGHIRSIAYFNTRLLNAQLQTLTAPSLAPTLSLDFTTGSYSVGL